MEVTIIGLDEGYEEVVSTPTTTKTSRKGGRPTRARTQPLRIVHNSLIDAEPSPAYSCRCWRCKSIGLPANDMAQMDRLLARHILRMPAIDQISWLREWEANPNHGSRGRQALRVWMEIEQGIRQPQPFYATKVGP